MIYNKKIGELTHDNLIAGVGGIKTGSLTIRAGEANYKRGTVFALSAGTAGDGKAVILGTAAASNEELVPYGILCDDVTVGAGADEVAEVYLSGVFNKDALIVSDSYEITTDDLIALRNGGIFVENIVD